MRPSSDRASDGQHAAVRTEMLSRRELLDAAGIDEKLLAELEAHGLVKRAGRLYGQDAVDIAATVAALTGYGVQARNLRTVGTAADRDLSLIEQLVGPVLRQRDPGRPADGGPDRRPGRRIAAAAAPRPAGGGPGRSRARRPVLLAGNQPQAGRQGRERMNRHGVRGVYVG